MFCTQLPNMRQAACAPSPGTQVHRETAHEAGVTVRSDRSGSIYDSQVIFLHSAFQEIFFSLIRAPACQGLRIATLLCKRERHYLLAAPADQLPRTGGCLQQASPQSAAAWPGREGQSAAAGCRASAWLSPAAASTRGCCPAPAPQGGHVSHTLMH